MSTVPETMRSLVAPKPCLPAKYEVMEMPVPSIKKDSDVLVRIHACGINTGDCQFARGLLIFPKRLP